MSESRISLNWIDLAGVRRARFGQVLPDLDLTLLAADDLYALQCAVEGEKSRRGWVNELNTNKL